MKKNMFKFILIIILVILFIVGILGYQKYKENKRYEEIIKSFEDAINWELDVTGTSKKNCEPNVTKRGITSATYLISQGYLKKESMLDIDGKSYCKAYAKTFDTEDCGVDYKIYLKCKNYKTNGWGGLDQ